MDLISRIDARSVAFARRVALFAVAGMLCLSGFIVVDVALRGLANAPIYGFVEAAQLIMAVALAACFPGGLAERRHISIEILERYFGARGDAVFSAVGHFFLLVFFVILCWRFALYTIEMGADVTQLLRLPTPPFWWTVTGFLALCISKELGKPFEELRHNERVFRVGFSSNCHLTLRRLRAAA